jgi:adenylate cyclase
MALWLLAASIESGEKQWFQIEDRPFLVGRRSAAEEPGKMSIAFDPTLSRSHFVARVEGEKLFISRDRKSKHLLFFKGESLDEFSLTCGDHFSSASTRFQFLKEGPSAEQPTRSFTLDAHELRRVHEKDSSRTLKALLGLQPLLSSAHEPPAFFKELLPLLRDIITGASLIMALKLSEDGSYEILESLGKGSDVFPSRSLLKMALESGDPAVYLWDDETSGIVGSPTACSGVRWAVAAPMCLQEERFALYAVGVTAPQETASPEIPGEIDRAVVSLVAQVVSQYLQGRRLSRLEGQLGQFFSPGLRNIVLKDPGHSLLALGMRDVTALFFDLRGFSRATEQSQDGQGDGRWSAFLDHHRTLQAIMTHVTECIFQTDGIVIDFQGDAVFACWGAPVAMEDHAARAARTAQAIMRCLSGEASSLLPQESGPVIPCGIGISSGAVLAGNVGLGGQIKYGIIGRCINGASRLEGLTKYFRVPVLITGETKALLPGDFLCRRVARVRPAGLDIPMDLYELVIPKECKGSGLAAEEAADYEKALEAFERGHLEEAESSLRAVPLHDPVRRFLNLKVELALLEGLPPHWEGIILFDRK